MRKYLTLLAALVLCMTFVSPGLADAPITVVVNGVALQSDISPQIINGRTMVPLRAVAESLNCNVDWNEPLNLVSITSKATTSNTGIELTGPDDFQAAMTEVLDKMDENTRLFCCRYIRQIIFEDPPQMMAADAASEVFPATNDNCYINGPFFYEAKSKVSYEELTFKYIGFIAHEATHLSMYQSGQDKIHSDIEQEALCDIEALQAITKAGGENSAFYGQFKKRLQSELQY